MATRNRTAQADNGDEQGPAAAGLAQGNNQELQELIREMRVQNQQRQQPPPPPPEVFKAPEYNGVGSVEVFIRQFSDVADANGWTMGAAFLHLRRALKDEASDCGAGNDVEEIFEALRARFGISPREARSKLSSLRKEYRTTLQEHATRVKELMRIAYPELPGGLQLEMGLDYFLNSLNNATLQRHLLAVRPATIAEAVSAGNEFLQVKTSSAGVKHLVGMEEELETQAMPLQGTPVATPVQPLPAQPVVTQPAPAPSVQPVATQPALVPALSQSDPMTVLLTTMAQLAAGVEAMQRMMTSKGEGKKRPVCWKCGQEGHVQKFCKTTGEGKTEQRNRAGQQ